MQDIGNWYGVTTNSAGRVTKLDLSNNKLIGEIPAALGQLTALRKLDLSNNKLIGEILEQSSRELKPPQQRAERFDSGGVGAVDRAPEAQPPRQRAERFDSG